MKNRPIYYQFLAWLLAGIYLLSPMKMILPYINYGLNYEYISTVLCENKEKVEIKCQGKCHLNKELKKAAEEESKNKQSQTINTEIKEIPLKEVQYITTPFLKKIQNQYPFFSQNLTSVSSELSTPPPKS